MQDAPYLGIPLHDKQGAVVAFALIDFADATQAKHRWCMHAGYVVRNSSRVGGAPGRTVHLHRELLGLVHGDGLEADHVNRDRLDNRRANLRVVTRAQNSQNLPAHRRGRSRHRGVHWDTTREKWVASVAIDRRRRYLGRFDSEEEAAAVVSAFRAKHMPFSEDAARAGTMTA